MAAENFDRIFDLVVGHEGAWGNDPNDRGNWTSGVVGKGENKGTKYGIAAHVYPHLDIKNLTLDDAKAIYRRDYWAYMRGDDMPGGVDYCLFDGAVNSGWFQANKWLQRALGVAADGRIGPITLGAMAGRSHMTLIDSVCDQRLTFLQSLSTWRLYKNGWSRRVAEVRNTAKGMVGKTVTPPPVIPPVVSAKPKKKYAATVGGLWGSIYSTGMKELVQKLKSQGVRAEYFSKGLFGYSNLSTVVDAARLAHGLGEEIILGGHSMGADLAVMAARELEKLGILVALVVCFDPTEFGLPLLPGNVRKAYCFTGTQDVLGGGVLKAENPQHQSRIVEEYVELPHIEIDNNVRLHGIVLAAAKAI
jgi:lysozyme family protein